MKATRIIVVEDDLMIALLLERQLTGFGYEVPAVVSSGEVAIEKIFELRPDLVLMDIHLKGLLDGIETAARIPAEFAIPIIYISASSDGSILARARDTKPYGYLVKPYSGAELHATIEMATERRLVDTALRASEEKYRATFDVVPVGIIHVAPDGSFLMVNSFFSTMLGFSSEELLAMNVLDVTVPEDFEQTHVQLARAQSGTMSSGNIIKRYLCKNGRHVWCDVTFIPQFDKDGRPTHNISVVNDITARKQADETILASEARYRMVIEQAPEGIIVYDLDEKRIVDVNRNAERIFGCDRAELLNAAPTAFFTPAQPDGQAVDETFAEHNRRVANGETVVFERAIRNARGEDYVCELRLSPMPSSTGRLLRASLIDITDRKRAEVAAREADEKYRATFDIAPVGIAHVGPDGRFLMVNNFFTDMLGYSREELLMMSVFDVTVAEDLETTRGRFTQTQTDTPSAGNIIKCYLCRDGHHAWGDVTFVPQFDKSGRLIHNISVIIDITARKQAEEQQLRLTTQLQQAQKMEAVGQLTGGLAHDFNNLLGVILGNLDFLEEGSAEGSDQRKLAQAAIRAAVRGADLTRSLLAFSRRQPLAPKLTELGEVLTSASQLFRRTLGQNIVLELRLADGLWPVMIDVAQLESAILNLAVNARDAMPSGGKLVIEAGNVTLDADAIERNLEATAGDYVVISISDTGTGMPPVIIAKVFDPFFTTKGSKGTGLGLSMVHGFVKQSGGHTRIYSELGRGTTIRIYLPRTADGPIDVGEEELDPLRATGTETILVVEDNEGLRDVGMRRLTALGYRTIAAGDATEALEIIKRGVPIDLLFTDVVMPGALDGRGLAEAARALRPDLKVLFTSGYTEAAASAALASQFGSNLLTKPYRKDELARRIRAAIDDDAA